MSDVLEIRVKKSHIAILSVVILVASASAAVNVRDSISVFGELDMQGNMVMNATEYRFAGSKAVQYAGDNTPRSELGLTEAQSAIQDYTQDTGRDPTLAETRQMISIFSNGGQLSDGVKAAAVNPQGKLLASGVSLTGPNNAELPGDPNFTFDEDIDMQGNNIYNAGNINGGTGGTTGGGGLTVPLYNDISSERQFGTTYTNNHDGPRLVTVIAQSGNAGGRADAFVNGNLVASFGSSESSSEGFQTLRFFVPQGADYEVQGFLNLEAWYEQDLQGGAGGTEGSGGGGVQTFGFSGGASGATSTSGYKTIRTETFDASEGVAILNGDVEVFDAFARDSPIPGARLRVTYEDGSEQLFDSGEKIIPRTTLKQPAVTEIRFEYKGGVDANRDYGPDSGSFRINLIKSGGGGGTGGTTLDWSSVRQVKDNAGEASVSCQSGEILTSVSCFSVRSGVSTLPLACDTRTSSSASIDGGGEVIGECVDMN